MKHLWALLTSDPVSVFLWVWVTAAAIVLVARFLNWAGIVEMS